MTRARRLLIVALIALALLFVAWFGGRREWFAVVVFAAPPVGFAISLLRAGGARAAFWSGVIALLWFSHGVMVAWTRPSEQPFALGEIALALIIVFAASIGGLRARFARGR